MDLLDSDQQLVDALPTEIRDKIDGFCENFIMQTAIAWDLREQPLPEGYQPESVDVFVNGNELSCLFIHNSEIKALDPEFFGERIKETLVIEINDEARYVQLHGELIVDSLGGCLLPDILVSPEAQLSYLTKFFAS